MPRAGLSTERVVAEAARLVDRPGLAELSLAELAGQLGVRVPSLYKHIGGLPDVQRRLALLGMSGLRDAVALADQHPDRRLAPFADAYRVFAKAHPGRYAAALRAPGPDDPELADLAAEVTGLLLLVVGSTGHGHVDALHDARAVRAALHGFVALELAGGFGLPVDVDDSFAHLVAMLQTWLDTPA